MNNLNFKTRTDELGNTFASIKDLIPSQLNKKIYGNEDAEDSKVNEIADDMKDRMARGLSANSNPVPVYPSGKMKGGHTRRLAAIKSTHKDEDDKDTIHRGIAKRHFTRSFTTADDVEVRGAEMKDGMLSIALEKIVPEAKKPRTIDIA